MYDGNGYKHRQKDLRVLLKRKEWDQGNGTPSKAMTDNSYHNDADDFVLVATWFMNFSFRSRCMYLHPEGYSVLDIGWMPVCGRVRVCVCVCICVWVFLMCLYVCLTNLTDFLPL